MDGEAQGSPSTTAAAGAAQATRTDETATTVATRREAGGDVPEDAVEDAAVGVRPDIHPSLAVDSSAEAGATAEVEAGARPDPSPVPRAPIGRPGLVIVNTGDGKGKTTAALGVLLRGWGRGMRVVMLQFIKKQTGNWSEIKAARRMGVEIIPLGDGFTWLSDDLERDKATVRRCWALCRERIESAAYDVVILDELTYPLSFGWLTWDEVHAVLAARHPGMHVIVTGRDAIPQLVEFADLITEMREVKHPYQRGIKAQAGIEF